MRLISNMEVHSHMAQYLNTYETSEFSNWSRHMRTKVDPLMFKAETIQNYFKLHHKMATDLKVSCQFPAKWETVRLRVPLAVEWVRQVLRHFSTDCTFYLLEH